MSYDDAWRFMVNNCGPDTAFFKARSSAIACHQASR